MQTLIAVGALCCYAAVIWQVFGGNIKAWFLELFARLYERAVETRQLNRMWDAGDA